MLTMAEWVKKNNPRIGFESMPIWACSNCGKAFTFQPDYNFCPYCGADMRKKEGVDNA